MILDKQRLEDLKIQSVGNGLIDLICSPDHIDTFIDLCNDYEISIKGFTWWCYVADGHEPCGMGGPKSRYFNGWFSEIQMDEIIKFSDNESYRYYFKNVWQADRDYHDCYWPGFWIDE